MQCIKKAAHASTFWMQFAFGVDTTGRVVAVKGEVPVSCSCSFSSMLTESPCHIFLEWCAKLGCSMLHCEEYDCEVTTSTICIINIYYNKFWSIQIFSNDLEYLKNVNTMMHQRDIFTGVSLKSVLCM